MLNPDRVNLPHWPTRCRRPHPPTPLPARADLEALWTAAAITTRDRKRLLRTLIANITVLPEIDEPGRHLRAPSCLTFDRFEWLGDEVDASAGGV
ncbi:MAG: hypothetical protein ACRDSZ_13220 [Pseudonocardiaceae bacterium]